MIPILYPANETAFTSQGLGALADSVSVKIARVLNGKDELTMVYPDTGIRFNDLQNDRIVYAQPEYKKTPQPYQIYKITKPLNGLITVCARQAAMLRSSFLPVLPFSDGSLTGVFNKLPDKLLESSPITFWTNKTVTADFNLTRPASLGNVLGGMEGSILDVYGGEYEFDGYTIKLWNRRGADNHVELRYGKNITNIEQSEDFSSIVTGVVPYWENMDGDTVTLPEHAVYGSMAGSYPFARTIVKDFSESFDDMPTEAQLRAKAVSYVENSQLPNVNLKVNFEHLAQYTEYEGMTLLETVNLGDTVAIYYDPLGVSASARIVSTNYDCLNEKYDSVQVGNVKNSLEQVMSGIADSAASVKEVINKTVPSAIESAVNNATAMITGVDGGYYIVNTDANGHPYETLWMDTDDIATAGKVIRINKNGIGFSKDGYDGPYIDAWTIDGNFVADFITTGTLTANVIKAGIIRDILNKNSWNLDTGVFTITNGTINVETSALQRDYITLKYGTNQQSMQAYGLRGEAVSNGETYKELVWPYGLNFYKGQNNDLCARYGNTGMVLYDASGYGRVNISNDGLIQLKDGNNKSCVSIDHWSAGGVIFLNNASESRRVRLGVDANAQKDTGELRLYGSNGNIRVKLIEDALSFYDANNNLIMDYPASGLAWKNLIPNRTETSDLNNCTDTGVYLYSSAAANRPITNAGGIILVLKASDTYCGQIAFANAATSPGTHSYLYARRKNGSGWQSWYRLDGTAV